MVNNKWDAKTTEEIKQYQSKKEELTVDNGVICWGHRVIAPTSLRSKILDELHGNHMGIVKTKAAARSFVWWPNIDRDIEERIKQCNPCLRNQGEPKRAEFTPWPVPVQVWERVHMDYFQLEDKNILILTDALSKYPEAFIMKPRNAKETEDKLRETFARNGLPKILVSDNGPQFVSQRLRELLVKNGIKQQTTAPYSPSSNGAAENSVKTLKMKLKTALDDEKNKETSLETLLQRFLFAYRNAQHNTTKQTSAKLMFGRKPRTRLELLKEHSKDQHPKEKTTVTNARNQIRLNNEKIHLKKGGNDKKFDLNQRVMAKDYRLINNKKWCPATITKKIGKTMYE